jgi:peptide/nickel transport system substrate-binding protein
VRTPRPAAAPRRRRAVVAGVLACLVLGGCSLLGGGDEDGSAAASAGAGQEGTTGWVRAKAADVESGGTLRLAVAELPANLNPVHADAVGSEVTRLLGPTTGNAVRITEDGGWEVDPDYAREVEVVDTDPFTVRVRLNPDAVWQGGTSITARDMVATWKALRGTDDEYEVADTDGWDAIADVREGDDRFEYEVELEDRRPDWPLFVYPRLAANVASDPKLFNDGFVRRAVSSNGPFVTTDVDVRTGTITQERNPRWWGDRPRLERIVWRVAEPAVQAKAFAADELDVATLDAEGYGEVDTDRVQRATGAEWTHLTLNAGRGPLRDDDVRRAIAAALDRQALAKAVADPLGARPTTADSVLVMPGQQGYDEVAEPRRRDLAGARSLLEKAGYEVSGGDAPRATKDGEQLTLTLPVVADAPSIATRAKAIAGQLADVGVRVQVRTVAADDFTPDVLVPLDFDLLTFSWGPSLLGAEAARDRFRPVTSTSNFTGVSSPAKPWNTARDAKDGTSLVRALAALEKDLRDEAVMVPIAVTPSVVAVREGVVNVGATSFEQPDWTTVGFRAED